MQKLFLMVTIVVAPLFIAGIASAVPPGDTVEYTPEGAGEVIFDGAAHAEKGIKCSACHPAIFPMEKGGATFTMKDMEAGEGCGACHNGTKAFGVKDPADCSKCHK